MTIPQPPALEGLHVAVPGQACGVPVAHRGLDAQLLRRAIHWDIWKFSKSWRYPNNGWFKEEKPHLQMDDLGVAKSNLQLTCRFIAIYGDSGTLIQHL